ncbi:ATPase, partial [Candidatus Thorarchaeota archaeon]
PTSEKFALRRGFDISTLAEQIYRAIDESKAKRLVVDCISALGVRYDEPMEVRTELLRISALLNELNVTSLLLCEINTPDTQSRAGVEQFITQGLISLNLVEEKDNLSREMLIWKMRQTHHSMNRHHFIIGKNGIEIMQKKKPTSKTR